MITRQFHLFNSYLCLKLVIHADTVKAWPAVEFCAITTDNVEEEVDGHAQTITASIARIGICLALHDPLILIEGCRLIDQHILSAITSLRHGEK